MSRKPKIPRVSPSVATLCKLASIVVHIEEGYSDSGHEFDIAAVKALIQDADVQIWIEGMQKLSLAPLKRTAETVSAAPDRKV